MRHRRAGERADRPRNRRTRRSLRPFRALSGGEGVVVYALDLPGHGQTAGPKRLGNAGAAAWDGMTEAVTALTVFVSRQHAGLPLISFGHSMGSALNQWQIQNNGHLLAGAILCGTFGELPEGLADEQIDRLAAMLSHAEIAVREAPSEAMMHAVGGFAAPFVEPGRSMNGSEWQTRDDAEVDAFLRDPLCGFAFSNEMTLSVLRGFQSLWTEAAESRIPGRLPLLVVGGEEDPVGKRTASIRGLIGRYMSLGLADLSFRFYPGDRHEILNEPDKDSVHRLIGHWIDSVLDR
ncbi:alpha/beta fold hydrolase [Lysobacter enzymogenes]|uniref:alpha/beta fold hydrolase n=1 Tax=Lysobacter enzymogenes TaxID=69 RepID=UPI002264F8C9|nr:alpha/beta fold hydrolase [Lysobacter enzymogenes]UZW62182.1 lysophospholipase [Lysobacter enzymogenes]